MSLVEQGLSGVLAAQRAMSVVGQNIANASSPGYSRRRVAFSGKEWSYAVGPFSGGGVHIAKVLRLSDTFINARVNARSASLHQSELMRKYMTDIEAALHEPGDYGLQAALDEFFNSVEALTTHPESSASRSLVIESALSLTLTIRELREEWLDSRGNVLTELSHAVDSVNQLTAELADNNFQIATAYARGSEVHGLLDVRDRLLSDLAELVEVQATPSDNGAVDLAIGGMLVVNDTEALTLSAPDKAGDPVTVESESSTHEVDVTGGRMRALLDLEKDIIPDYLDCIDELAAALIREVNRVHAEGLGLDGGFTSLTSQTAAQDVDENGDSSDDLLNDAGLALTPSAGALRVALVDQATSGRTVSEIEVDPGTQSLADLADALDAIAHLSASVSNGRITIQADSGYKFDFVEDQGTDILACLAINAFFDGGDASDIDVQQALRDDNGLLAAAQSESVGDSSNAIRMAGLREEPVLDDDSVTLAEYWRGLVAQIGSRTSRAKHNEETQEALFDAVVEQRDSIQGVSLDEEAVLLIKYQQMYQACAYFVNKVSYLTEMLLRYV